MAAKGNDAAPIAVPWQLHGRRAVLATMHGKERVIAPILLERLGLVVSVPHGLDTDRFGTFSREVPRTGTALDAARAKIDAVFAIDSMARIGIASEGSFGPHPQIAFAPFAQELVVLVDRETGLELHGIDAGIATHFQHDMVTNIGSSRAFADRIGFPSHGLIVMGICDAKPAPKIALAKDIGDYERLDAAVRVAIDACGHAHMETDMRAHRNPTRMRAIERATHDLLRSWQSRCAYCARPGLTVSEWISGLPCEWCRAPTEQWRAQIFICKGCRHREERVRDHPFAEPEHCAFCNP